MSSSAVCKQKGDEELKYKEMNDSGWSRLIDNPDCNIDMLLICLFHKPTHRPLKARTVHVHSDLP